MLQIRSDIEQPGEEIFEKTTGVSSVPDEEMDEHRVPFRHVHGPFADQSPISDSVRSNQTRVIPFFYLYNVYNQVSQSSGGTAGTFG